MMRISINTIDTKVLSHLITKRSISNLFHNSSYNITNKNVNNRIKQFSTNSIVSNISEYPTTIFLKLSQSYPVHLTQEYLVYFHDITGLPWWSTIIISTFILRSCVTLPLAVYQNKILAKLENLANEMPQIEKELKMETAYAIKKFNWSKEHAASVYRRSLRKQWNKLIVRDNCHPMKTTILIWIQLPMWICLSAALRNLVYMFPNNDLKAQMIFTQLQLGGFLWIPNLTIADSSFILPVLLGLINLTIVQVQTLTKVQKRTKIQKYLTNFFRLVSIGLIPIAATVPSCLCLYWVSSSTFGLLQNLFLLSPQVKNVLRIPLTKRDVPEPYRVLWAELKKRLFI